MRHLEPSGVLKILTFEALLGEFSGFKFEITLALVGYLA